MRISGWSSDVCSSDLASTSRWRTRPSAETAYSTPRCPSRAAYSTMLAFGAKLGDSSSDPGDSVDQRGDPRLRSSNAIRSTLPLPCAPAIFLSSYDTVGLALYLRSEERRVGKECGSTFISRWSQ